MPEHVLVTRAGLVADQTEQSILVFLSHRRRRRPLAGLSFFQQHRLFLSQVQLCLPSCHSFSLLAKVSPKLTCTNESWLYNNNSVGP